ncbi:hypothetical protein MRX96_041338 [Rhipicephalus microplus]
MPEKTPAPTLGPLRPVDECSDEAFHGTVLTPLLASLHRNAARDFRSDRCHSMGVLAQPTSPDAMAASGKSAWSAAARYGCSAGTRGRNSLAETRRPNLAYPADEIMRERSTERQPFRVHDAKLLDTRVLF